MTNRLTTWRHITTIAAVFIAAIAATLAVTALVAPTQVAAAPPAPCELDTQCDGRGGGHTGDTGDRGPSCTIKLNHTFPNPVLAGDRVHADVTASKTMQVKAFYVQSNARYPQERAGGTYTLTPGNQEIYNVLTAPDVSHGTPFAIVLRPADPSCHSTGASFVVVPRAY